MSAGWSRRFSRLASLIHSRQASLWFWPSRSSLSSSRTTTSVRSRAPRCSVPAPSTCRAASPRLDGLPRSRAITGMEPFGQVDKTLGRTGLANGPSTRQQERECLRQRFDSSRIGLANPTHQVVDRSTRHEVQKGRLERASSCPHRLRPSLLGEPCGWCGCAASASTRSCHVRPRTAYPWSRRAARLLASSATPVDDRTGMELPAVAEYGQAWDRLVAAIEDEVGLDCAKSELWLHDPGAGRHPG